MNKRFKVKIYKTCVKPIHINIRYRSKSIQQNNEKNPSKNIIGNTQKHLRVHSKWQKKKHGHKTRIWGGRHNQMGRRGRRAWNDYLCGQNGQRKIGENRVRWYTTDTRRTSKEIDRTVDINLSGKLINWNPSA